MLSEYYILAFQTASSLVENHYKSLKVSHAVFLLLSPTDTVSHLVTASNIGSATHYQYQVQGLLHE